MSKNISKDPIKRANQLNNLILIKKGQVMNPTGKSDRSIKGIIKDILSREMTFQDAIDSRKKKMTVKEAMILKMVTVAIQEGSVKHAESVFDRLEGKVVQKTEVKNVDTDSILKEKFSNISDEHLEQIKGILSNYETKDE